MPTPKSAIIIGSGIGGPLCALALTRKQIPVRLYESRSSPATLGGAINLTPNAVRILANFDLLPKFLSLGCSVTKLQFFSAYSGAALGTIPFGSIEQYGFESLRVCRADLQRVLLEAVAERGIEVSYNKKLVGVEEDAVDGDHITAVFSDGSKETADLLIGADGIHSAVRRSFVDPGCDAAYSGICSAYGFASWDKVAKEGIEFDTTALAVGRKGSFLMSFCNPEKTRVFWAVVMAISEGEVPEREDAGWRVRDEGRTKSEIVARFDDSEKWRETVRTAVMAEDETFFFPVNELPTEGRWWRGRCVLIGDAAHAVSGPSYGDNS
jgi:salicylate hydroxylase